MLRCGVTLSTCTTTQEPSACVSCVPVQARLRWTGGRPFPAQGWPRMLLSVWHLDDDGRLELQGYGVLHVPCTPGSYEVSCPTWRPAGTPSQEMAAAFVGGVPHLKSTSVLYTDQQHRKNIATVSSGTVRDEPSQLASARRPHTGTPPFPGTRALRRCDAELPHLRRGPGPSGHSHDSGRCVRSVAQECIEQPYTKPCLHREVFHPWRCGREEGGEGADTLIHGEPWGGRERRPSPAQHLRHPRKRGQVSSRRGGRAGAEQGSSRILKPSS